MIARIYQPTKSIMQSGKKDLKWRLEFASDEKTKFLEPLMFRTSSKDTSTQISLKFDFKDQAIKYAEKYGYEFEVIDVKQRSIKRKLYLIKS